jgi:hypothetical protein
MSQCSGTFKNGIDKPTKKAITLSLTKELFF